MMADPQTRADARALRAALGPAPDLSALSDEDLAELAELSTCWQFQAHDYQHRPDDCAPLLLCQWGRGTGKTRMGAEETLDACEDYGEQLRGALISKTVGDVRDVMIEGPSGLKACARRRGYDVEYIANRALVLHPSGARLHVMSADAPDFGRGPNLNWIWPDEIAAWPHNSLQGFQVLLLAWRLPLGDRGPSGIITTTPKPNAIMQWLTKAPEARGLVTVSKGVSTSRNAANIHAGPLIAALSGSRLGQQEIDGILLESGVMLTPEMIEARRIKRLPEDVHRRLVAVDPSIGIKDTSDACGIVAAGADSTGHAITLEDATIQGATWGQWARRVVQVAVHWNADEIVAELNQGGQGVLEILQTAMDDAGVRIPIVSVWATKTKRARAEPCCAKVETGHVFFLDHMPHLERELTTWIEGMPSPNAMDAWSMAVSRLLFGDEAQVGPLGAYIT